MLTRHFFLLVFSQFNFSDDDSLNNSVNHGQGGRGGFLPNIHASGGMQAVNDSGQFNFGDSFDGRSQVSRRSWEPKRTGGAVDIREQFNKLDREDKLPPEQKRDIHMIESLMPETNPRTFETNPKNTSRYVEQIKTGLFMSVKKDVDLNDRIGDEGGAEPIANRYAVEADLIQAQQRWAARIANLFTGSLGLLAGMSLMHLFLISLFTDSQGFLAFYA